MTPELIANMAAENKFGRLAEKARIYAAKPRECTTSVQDALNSAAWYAAYIEKNDDLASAFSSALKTYNQLEAEGKV